MLLTLLGRAVFDAVGSAVSEHRVETNVVTPWLEIASNIKTRVAACRVHGLIDAFVLKDAVEAFRPGILEAFTGFMLIRLTPLRGIHLTGLSQVSDVHYG